MLVLHVTDHNYIRGMLDADRALGRIAYQRDIDFAFKDAFSGDAVVLDPSVRAAIDWLASKPFQPKAKLFWDVNRAEISAQGEFGYTTGAWTLKRKTEYTNGDFVRIWKKVGHNWKVALQAQVSTGLPRVALGEVLIPKRPKSLKLIRQGEDLQTVIMKDEEEISRHEESAKSLFLADAYFLRSGLPPSTGFTPELSAVETKPVKEFFLADKGSDLACSYGELASEGTPRPFLRIWHCAPKEGWQVCLEYIGGASLATFKGIPPQKG